MHKNKDFGIVSLYSSDWEIIIDKPSSLSAAAPPPSEGGLVMSTGGAGRRGGRVVQG